MTAVLPPQRMFISGPQGEFYYWVFPGLGGRLPAYAVVREPHTAPPWTLPDFARDTAAAEHVFQRSEAYALNDHPEAGRRVYYKHIQTFFAADQPRFVCIQCGGSSRAPEDVAEGYCGNCHDQTRVPHWAVLRAAPGQPVSPSMTVTGRWFERDRAVAMSRQGPEAGRPGSVVPTGTFEQSPLGPFAQVFYLYSTDEEAR